MFIITYHLSLAGKRVLFILGWGVTLQDAGIKWFQAKAAEQGWDLMTVALPLCFADYKDILRQIQAVHREYNPDAIIAFSMGAIFASWLPAKARVFISPYWGNHPRKLILGSYGLTKVLMRILSVIRVPLIYRGYTDADIGSIDLSGVIPQRIAPCTVWAVLQAQEARPLPQPGDLIYYFPGDVIIDASLCKGVETHIFAGGHDFMATPERDVVFAGIAERINQASPALLP